MVPSISIYGAEVFSSSDRPARVDSVTVDEGGSIFLTGGFNIFNDAFSAGLIKLHPYGEVDTRFAPGIGVADFAPHSVFNDLILNPDSTDSLIAGDNSVNTGGHPSS